MESVGGEERSMTSGVRVGPKVGERWKRFKLVLVLCF